MAAGDILYEGPVLREAQDRFDQAAHDNYEGARYVDVEIELKATYPDERTLFGFNKRRLIRSFGPRDPAPRYFHPLAPWIDKGLRD